jgi:hypothetical protein
VAPAEPKARLRNRKRAGPTNAEMTSNVQITTCRCWWQIEIASAHSLRPQAMEESNMWEDPPNDALGRIWRHLRKSPMS